jgi:hypothetical protein
MTPFGLASPLGLAALGALGVLVWLRLRQGRQQTVDVPSLLLWGAVRDDRERRRFRVDALFVLQALLVLLLAFALAGPYGGSDADAAPRRRIAFVFDTSASMQTREPGGRRFDLARGRARELLGELREGDESVVVAVDVRPRLVAPLTSDRRAALAAIEALEPSEGLSRLAFGIQLARSVAAGAVEVEIVVLTDLPRDEVEIPIAADERLRWVRVGSTDDNVAVSALRVDRNPFEDAAAARAFAAVRNYARRPHEVVLRVALGGREIHTESLELAPGESRVVPIRGLEGSGRLEATIEVGDALAADDRAFAWVPPDRVIDVVAVTDRPGLAADLEALARAAPAIALRLVPPGEAATASFADADVVIFHEFLPGGPLPANALFVHPAGDTPWFGVGGDVVGARILDWDEDHALLRDLRYLDAVVLGPTRRIRPPAWGRPVIRSSADREEFPLAFAGETEGRRIVCFAFDLGDGSLRRSEHLSLLLLVLNSIRWLTPPDPSWPLALDVGETFRDDLAEPSVVTVAAGDRGPEEVGRLRSLELVVDRVGEIRVVAGDRERLLLGNLFDEEESNVGRAAAPGETVEIGTGRTALAERRVEVRAGGLVDLATPLLYAVVAILLLEWALAWRRRHDVD